MKKLLIAAVVAVISSGAIAADLKPYIEGSIGYYNLDDVETKTYSGNLNVNGTNVAFSGKAKTEYKSDVGGGIELGLRDVGISNLRLGASYQRMQFDMEKVIASVAVSLAGTTYSQSADITSAVRAENINLDNSVKVYMLNAYYDFKNSSQFTPFVGAGIGMADIQNAKDNELALSASLGGKYNFDKNIYLGLKGAFTRVNGPTDKIGIEYEDIDLWSAHALLGYEF